MAYNPGISYRGDQYLAQGITSAADSIADTIKKYGEENELVKSYRSVAKNTPGFYDSMGISKEEMGGMGNKDVMALFKGYALKTAMQDQQQQRQFAINAEARSVAATQLAATQEERLKKASDGLTAYNQARGLEAGAQATKQNELTKRLEEDRDNESFFGEFMSRYDVYNPDASDLERALEAKRTASQLGLSLPYQKALHKEWSDLNSRSKPVETQTGPNGETLYFQDNVLLKVISNQPNKPVDKGNWVRIKDDDGKPTDMMINVDTYETRKNEPLKEVPPNRFNQFLNANPKANPDSNAKPAPPKKTTVEK